MGTIATEAQNIKFRAGQFIKGRYINETSIKRTNLLRRP